MRKNLRNLILNLKGPPCTYCNCSKVCSDLEIDHVVPVWYLKQELTNKSKALYDPHNLYRCCSIMNRKKGAFMLDIKFTGNEISGLMARSYLYMDWKYNLYFDKTTIQHLKTMSTINPPFLFEYERASKISKITGNKNLFIDDYPKMIHRLQ